MVEEEEQEEISVSKRGKRSWTITVSLYRIIYSGSGVSFIEYLESFFSFWIVHAFLGSKQALKTIYWKKRKKDQKG